MKYSKIAVAALVLLTAGAFAADSCRAAAVEEIALYNKSDRQKILLEGAKKEGKVSWYTSLIVDQVVRPVKEGGGRFKRALYFTPDAQLNEGNAWVDYFENNFMR